MKLRPYQIECNAAVIAKLSVHRSTLVEMATGLGKTVCFGHIADEWPGRVLVIAHRDELIRQAAEKVTAITGRSVAIEMGRESATDELYGTKVTVASIQTLARSQRRSRFHPDHFSLIVVDEGHHAAAVTYREVLEYFHSAKRLFVTATPKRADKVALEHICESVAYQYGIEPAIDDGWLVPVQQRVVKIEGLDFSKARTVAEDFNQADLERILTEEKPLHAMCASSFELIGNRQALWFCASVSHARAVAGVLSRYASSDLVRFLSGDTPKEDRRQAVDDYKTGRIQHLVNCALFLEGFDAPTTSVIIMARPTKSLSLYMQVLGRGTRPLPGVVDCFLTPEARQEAIRESLKPSMLVIDFAGNAGRHKIIQASDVLGGKHEPPVRQHAKENMESEGRTVDLAEALNRAAAELAFMEEHETMRRKIKAEVSYRTEEIDPFVKKFHQKNKGLNTQPVEPPTDKMVRFLLMLSHKTGGTWTFDEAKKLSFQQCRGVISKLKNKAGIV